MILRFAIRNLLKRPFLSLIKVIGLSLAFSGILGIVLFLKKELTFDTFHKKSDRIYRLTVTDPSIFNGSHFARIYNPEFIPAMAEYFPEIENYVRLVPVRGGVLKHEENYILVNQAFECDSTFFEVFDAELLTGNPENILNGPGSMVLSESFSKKVFGNDNPEGKVLTLPSGQFYGRDIDFTVKGVMKDFPQNSHLHPDFITTPVDKSILESWAWTYLVLVRNADPGKIISEFKNFYFSHVDNKTQEISKEAHLQKITGIHLHSAKLREIESNSNMTVIYTLSIASLILLLIALANYANLNAGMAYFSDKYLFMSKVLGASNRMTLKYYIIEGIIIISAAIAISAIILVPANLLILKYLGSYLFTGNLYMITITTLLLGILGILSGIFPLIKQGASKLQMSAELRSSLNPGRKGIGKGIIIMQYAISTVLIVAVLVIHRQTEYALKSGLGVQNENIICFRNVHTVVQQKFEIFKQELLKYNSVELVSAMFEPPGGEANDMFQFNMEGYVPDETNSTDNFIGVFPCDYSFPAIFNLHFLGGSNFSEKNEDNEGSGEYIINESAMKKLNYTDPGKIIGKEFKLITNIEGVDLPEGKIIGVVEDFHLSNIRKKIEPLVLFKQKELWLLNFVVSLRPGMEKKALSDIEIVWTEMFSEYPFKYEYVSSIYKDLYRPERIQSLLLSIFTFIALFICSMGLLGMSLFTIRRRTKEIGLRKINGAETEEVMLMLSIDQIKWILLSLVISFPLSYYAMHKWLQSFAYKRSLSWWIFALAGITVVFIALLTVSVQSWKAATRNPVETIRYE
jgi:putative ABC transport system permease protein